MMSDHRDNFMYREEDFKPTISGYLFGLTLVGLSGFIIGLLVAVAVMRWFASP